MFGSQHLFEKYHTSLNIKNTVNVVKKVDISANFCDGKHYFF